MEAAKSHFKITIDEQFLDVLSIPLIAGRDLVYEKDSTSFGKNVNHILVNEASLRAAGIATKDAVGARLYVSTPNIKAIEACFRLRGWCKTFINFRCTEKFPQ